MSSGAYTDSKSRSATRGDEITCAFRSSFHNGEPGHEPSPPPFTDTPSRISMRSTNDSPSPHESTDNSDHEDNAMPTAKATKRDKIVGKVEQVIGKAIRDPELHERAVLRAAGGKDLADGLALVDSKTL